MSFFDESMKTLTSALISNSYKNNIEKNGELIGKLKEIQEKTNNELLSLIQIAQDDLTDVIQYIYEIPAQVNDDIVRYIVNGVYTEFHERRIEKLEGSICCTDKAMYITEMTLKALKLQQNLTTNNYLSLKCVKDTDEALNFFWKWFRLES